MPRTLSVSLVVIFFTTLLSGCGDEVGRTVPVSGKVLLEGKAVTAGSVTFWPDADKKNTSKLEAVSQIDESGTYTLTTRGKAGAPPGWYKVVVTATEKANPEEPYAVLKSLVDKKYTDLATTPLSVEVVDSPAASAYDLKVTE